jgi:hypothetical protein
MERKGPTRPALRRMEQHDEVFTNPHHIDTFLKEEYVHAFSDDHSVKEDIWKVAAKAMKGKRKCTSCHTYFGTRKYRFVTLILGQREYYVVSSH